MVRGSFLLREGQRREVAKAAVRADVVVFPAPVFEHDARFGEAPELFAVQAFLAQAGVEALDLAVLPRATRINVDRFDPGIFDPLAQFLLDKLRAVVAPDVLRRAMFGHELREHLAYFGGIDAAIHVDTEALARVFIDDVE